MSEPVSIEEQFASVEREVRMRRRVYPGWIRAGKMTEEKAEHEIRAMEAVLETLRPMLPAPAQSALFV